MNNFFAELKRRNVVRVAIAYVVVSWVILQFVDIIQDPMALPDWFQKVTIVFLGIGLPIALLLSWAYEVTPEGVKKTEEVDKSKSITHGTGHRINKLIVGALVLALAFITYDKMIAPSPVTISGDREASIAVLPFTDMSPKGDQEYFSDGIAEEILNVLAKIPGLKVAGRTSSFKFKGQNENLQLIAEQLNVDHILEGSVRKDGTRIRVTVQLIAADDGFHLWSETYDRELVDIFAIQDEISAAVAEAMKIQLGTGDDTAVVQRVSNAEAYSLYLRGRQFLHARGTENLQKAGKIFEAVTVLDPDFGPAYAALSRTYGLLPTYEIGSGDTEQICRKGKAAAYRALALNPQDAEAYSGLSFINFSQLDWAEAEKNNLMATTLAPNDAEIANFAGDYYRFIGDVENGIKWEGRALELDPLHAVNSWDLAYAYYEAGRPGEGLPFAENAISVDANFEYLYQIVTYIYADLGRFDEARAAIRAAEVVSNTPAFITDLKTYLALREGNTEQVRANLVEMEALVNKGQMSPSRLVGYYLDIGELEKGAPSGLSALMLKLIP